MRKLLGTLDGGDRVAVVGVAQSAEVLAPWGSSGIAEHAVAGLKPTSENGQLAETTRWTAILTIVVQVPRNPDRLRANPLGIYVNAINWSRELGQ